MRLERAMTLLCVLMVGAATGCSKDPEVLAHLARAADRAGRAEAAELYRRTLDEAELSATAREEIAKRLKELENERP